SISHAPTPGGSRRLGVNRNMNISRYTEKAQEALVTAQRETEERRLAQLDVEPLLYALVSQRDGIVPQILLRLDIDPRVAQADLLRTVEESPTLQYSAQPVIAPNLRRLLERA